MEHDSEEGKAMEKNDELTAQEEAFFESGGTTPLPDVDTAPAATNDGGPPEAATPMGSAISETRREGDGVVPLAALHEERERRKSATLRLQEEMARRVALETQLAQAARRNGDAVDASGAGGSRQPAESGNGTDTHAGRLHGIDQRIAQQEARAVRGEAIHQMIGGYRAHAGAARKANAEFDLAYRYLLGQWDGELSEAGYREPHERKAILMQWETDVAARALAVGEDPGERIVKLAERRGYKRGGVAGNAQERIAALARGAEAARSLGAAAGRAEPAETPEGLLQISDDDEFARGWDRVFRRH